MNVIQKIITYDTHVEILNDKDELHCDFSAAIKYPDGSKKWYLNGQLHREDGPAVEFANGYKEWFLNDLEYTEEEFNEMMKNKSTRTVSDNGNVFWKNQDGKYHREDGPAIEYWDGYKAWYLNGELHREDGPAIEDVDGYKAWFINGKRHREDGPAVEYSDGTKEWFINGEYHREDGPAVKSSDGSKAWCINDELHREDGPAVEFSNGDKYWYLNGIKYTEEDFNEKMKNKSTKTVDDNGNVFWKNQNGQFHREDGPAVEYYNGYKSWFINGKRHREDGPAVEYADGSKEWFIDGVEYSEEEFNEKILDENTRGFDVIPENEKHAVMNSQQKNISNGGPSTYYDVFPEDIKTANDIIEHMSINIWKEFSCHMKDVFKAITRWGTKEGTSKEYDARKLVYSGLRMLRMIVGNEKTREYLKELLDDKQFK